MRRELQTRYDHAIKRFGNLNESEMEVANLLVPGYSYKQVAFSCTAVCELLNGGDTRFSRKLTSNLLLSSL